MTQTGVLLIGESPLEPNSVAPCKDMYEGHSTIRGRRVMEAQDGSAG